MEGEVGGGEWFGIAEEAQAGVERVQSTRMSEPETTQFVVRAENTTMQARCEVC